MIRLFTRHTAVDYAAWRGAYDGLDAERPKLGVIDHAAYQAVNDPNNVTVWHDFATREQAEAFLDRLRNTMQQAEARGKPAEAWLVKQEKKMTPEDHRTEFQALRTEIERRSEEQNTTERQTAYGIVAVYAVLFGFVGANGGNDATTLSEIRPFLWWVPFFLATYGLLRWSLNDRIIGAIGKYISTTPLNEWELFVNKKITMPWYLIRFTWLMVIFATFVAALSVTVCDSPACLIKYLFSGLFG